MLKITVEDFFHISGRGSVMTGEVLSGALYVGDIINVNSPGNTVTVRVEGIEINRTVVSSAKPGDKVGILLTQFSPEKVKDGLILAGEPPVWKVTSLNISGVDKPWWKFW